MHWGTPMSNQHPDMRRDDLLRRALVPKGYRPTKDADIEKMLDAICDHPIDEAKFQRMLRKINGQEPTFPERPSPVPSLTGQLTPEEQEVFALCRSKNKPLPPDLAAKVKALEEKAAKKPGPGGDAPRG